MNNIQLNDADHETVIAALSSIKRLLEKDGFEQMNMSRIIQDIREQC